MKTLIVVALLAVTVGCKSPLSGTAERLWLDIQPEYLRYVEADEALSAGSKEVRRMHCELLGEVLKEAQK